MIVFREKGRYGMVRARIRKVEDKSIAAKGFARFLFYLVQFTWGLPQNLAGAFWFLCCLRKKHSLYHGAIVTRVHRKNFSGGWTFGCFIFLTEPLLPDTEHDLRIHEYGHTVQSLFLGPLWSLVIGLPSMLWCNLPPFQRLRRDRAIPDSALYCEGWADRLGQKVLGERFLRGLD